MADSVLGPWVGFNALGALETAALLVVLWAALFVLSKIFYRPFVLGTATAEQLSAYRAGVAAWEGGHPRRVPNVIPRSQRKAWMRGYRDAARFGVDYARASIPTIGHSDAPELRGGSSEI
jgi:hypothetical protein